MIPVVFYGDRLGDKRKQRQGDQLRVTGVTQRRPDLEQWKWEEEGVEQREDPRSTASWITQVGQEIKAVGDFLSTVSLGERNGAWEKKSKDSL